MTAIDISKMSEAELKAALKAKQEQRSTDREAYKNLVDETVPSLLEKIKDLSILLSEVKADIYSAFEDLLKLKFDIYDVKEEQQSHTFTTSKSNLSISIGYNVNDGWDDTVNSGIAKINEYIKSLANDGNKDTITIINQLLKRDDKGHLKSSRVLELAALATKLQNPIFSDAVEIIKNSYRPQRSSFFVKAWEVDKAGNKVYFPLSISSVPFPADFDYSFVIPTADE